MMSNLAGEGILVARGGCVWTRQAAAMARRRYTQGVMKFLPALLCVNSCLALAAVGERAGAQAAPLADGSCLSELIGTWRGPGVVLGRPIVMEQRWERAISGAFSELTMRHFTTDTSTRPAFEGRGFYRMEDAGAPDSIAGTWFDARGLTFSIAGSCHGTALSSHWTGVERGRTIYARERDELVVIDSVFPASGGGREFGRSRLRRYFPPDS